MKHATRIVFALVAACALALSLVACSQPTPTSVTTDAMNAVKTQGFAALASYCQGDVGVGDTADSISSIQSESDMGDAEKAIVESYAAKLLAYDFTVSNEQVSGDTATVDVSYKAYDCATPFKEALGRYFTQALGAAFASALSGSSESADSSDCIAFFYDELKNQVDSMSEKSLSYTGKVTLSKVDGKWVITAVDDNVKDGMTGGLYSYASSVNDSISKLSSSNSSFTSL